MEAIYYLSISMSFIGLIQVFVIQPIHSFFHHRTKKQSKKADKNNLNGRIHVSESQIAQEDKLKFEEKAESIAVSGGTAAF